MAARTPVVVASPPSSSGGPPPGTPLTDMALPLLTPASGGSRLGRAASSQQQQQQRSPLLQTPSFSSRGFGTDLRSPPPSSGGGGGGSGRPPRAPAGSVGRRLSGAAAVSAGAPRPSGSRRLSAPTGYSESAASDGATPSFSMQAPSGWSSDEEEDDDEVDSAAVATGRWRRGDGRRMLRALSPADVALGEVAARLEAQLQISTQRQLAAFDRALLEIDQEEAAGVAAAAAERAQRADAAAAVEAAAARARRAEKEQLLSGLRVEHQQKAAAGQRQVEEVARQQQQERERERQAAAAKAAAQQRAAEEAAAAKKATAEAATAAQQQRAAADKAAAEASQQAAATAEQQKQQQAQRKAEAAAASAGPGVLRVAPSAAAWGKHCAERLLAAQAVAKPFAEDRAMRDKKRAIDKFVTLSVQQISATLEQVRAKALALSEFVAQQAQQAGGPDGPQHAYALLTLASKLLSQCEVQITRLNSFCFPLAEVAVAVAAVHPQFVDLLCGRMHQACPLTVPQYWLYRSGADEDEYLQLLGYRITRDEDTGEVSREPADEYVGRMQGYLLLYAAITQSDNPRNPHGLQHAWELLSRLLNALPANRMTATAVQSVLKVAGYRMHRAYRSQFLKLLQYIDAHFLPALGASADPDARAVYTRIQTYLRAAEYRQVPEGREMPQFDASSYDRA